MHSHTLTATQSQFSIACLSCASKPSASELQRLAEKKLACVENFVIGRGGCGKITFVDAVLGELVAFSQGEVVV